MEAFRAEGRGGYLDLGRLTPAEYAGWMAALVLVGRPKNEATDLAIEISLQIGYFAALLACLGMAVSGYLRQSRYKEGRKPPGVI